MYVVGGRRRGRRGLLLETPKSECLVSEDVPVIQIGNSRLERECESWSSCRCSEKRSEYGSKTHDEQRSLMRRDKQSERRS